MTDPSALFVHSRGDAADIPMRPSRHTGTADFADPVPEEHFSFADVLDVVNPLHHIPIVGSIYRWLTGDEISGASRVMGAAIYGGPISMGVAMGNAYLQDTTGRDGPENLAARVLGEDVVPAGDTGLEGGATGEIALAEAPTAAQTAAASSVPGTPGLIEAQAAAQAGLLDQAVDGPGPALAAASQTLTPEQAAALFPTAGEAARAGLLQTHTSDQPNLNAASAAARASLLDAPGSDRMAAAQAQDLTATASQNGARHPFEALLNPASLNAALAAQEQTSDASAVLAAPQRTTGARERAQERQGQNVTPQAGAVSPTGTGSDAMPQPADPAAIAGIMARNLDAYRRQDLAPS